eukprot:SAG31_NODE_1_length_62978_cov_30.836130_24_plen_223_part_00
MSNLEDFVLDGSGSADPDCRGAPGDQCSVAVAWACFSIDPDQPERITDSCFIDGTYGGMLPISQSPILRLAGSQLRLDRSLVFQVAVTTDDGRQATDFRVFTVTDRRVADIDIVLGPTDTRRVCDAESCRDVPLVQYTSRFSLASLHAPASDVVSSSFAWDVKQGEDSALRLNDAQQMYDIVVSGDRTSDAVTFKAKFLDPVGICIRLRWLFLCALQIVVSS